jgi:YbbR domain-containing protein
MDWLRSTGLRLLLALGLSISLWAFVSFSQNPDRRAPFDGLNVVVSGLAPGLIIVDQDGMPRPSLPPVNVIVEADAATLETVRNSDITTAVDLTDRNAGEHVVQVRAATNRSDLAGRLTMTVEPGFLPIRLEQVLTQTVPLTVNLSGSLPFSFEAGQPQARDASGDELQTVQVRGPQGRVEQVAGARAAVSIQSLRADYTSSVPLEAVDAGDRPVEGVTVLPGSVQVLVPIRSVVGVRRVGVLGTISGAPAPGYVVSGISSDPPLVNLTGSSGPLDVVSQVETEPVDIAGATGTITREVALRLPAGTLLQDGQPTRAVITVTIVPVTRPFQLALPVPVQPANLGAGLLLSYNPPVVSITVAGTSGALAALSSSPLQGTIDLSGLGPGTTNVRVEVPLPPGVQLVGTAPEVSVTLRLIPSPTPPPPTRTPEPAAPTDDTSAATATAEPGTPTPAPPGPTETASAPAQPGPTSTTTSAP